MLYSGKVIYHSADKINWYFGGDEEGYAPKRLSEAEGIRVSQPELPAKLRTVLYHAREGFYVVGPDILVPYAISFNRRNGISHLETNEYGETWCFDKYTDALRKFNDITNANLQHDSLERENQVAESKAIKQVSKILNVPQESIEKVSKAGPGRKRGALTVPNAKVYISIHKRKQNLSPARLEEIVDFLIEAGETAYLEKHLGL